MVAALSKAIAAISALPEDRQELMATVIMSELGAEAKWDELFAQSSDMLGSMAEAAWAEYAAGSTVEIPCVSSWSYRKFVHPTKPGVVIVSGNLHTDMPPGTLNSVLRQAGLK